MIFFSKQKKRVPKSEYNYQMGTIQQMMVSVKAFHDYGLLIYHDGYFQGNLELEKHSCSWTGYQNDWDKEMTYTVPSDSMINGVSSYHSNSKEDRKFKYQTCKTRIRSMCLIS